MSSFRINKGLLFLVGTTLLASNFTIQAALVQPDSALASSEFTAGFDGTAMNTIDGSGLPVSFTTSDAHGPYVTGTHWTTTLEEPPTDQSITWGFSTPQTLSHIYIWNHLSTSSPASNTGYEVTLFDLTLFDAGNAPILVLNDVAMQPNTAFAQTFSFGGTVTGVSSVLFEIEAVEFSPDFTGLAEIAFETSVVPIPAAVWLFGPAIGLLGWRQRKNT